MRSERGVTLIALITIIIVLIIMISIGIYSGVNSYKVINFEKYKSQMQLIQNAVDELYEENKNNAIKGNDIIKYEEEFRIPSDYGNKVKNFWNEEIAETKFGIDLESEDYYCLTAGEIEEIFKLENIDISEYFIINFEKRYVFSVTPIQVIIGENADGTSRTEDIYCLYQLDEEEKVIEFKTDGKFEYIIYKEEDKQNIEIINNINIKKVEIDVGEGYVDIHTRKDYCPKITGLHTRKVKLEIVKDCKIKVTDTLENYDERRIKIYNIPFLEKNMIPIIPQSEKKGKISYIDDPKWYDYYITTNDEGKEIIDEEKTNFAVAINAITKYITEDTTYENYYKDNVSDKVNTILDISNIKDNNPVKVWIPRNLMEFVDNTNLMIFIERDTGIWVEAIWNGEKYVPAIGY